MAIVIKASRYTHAKKGYLVFSGSYPNVKHKYFKAKSSALKQKKKWEKAERSVKRRR